MFKCKKNKVKNNIKYFCVGRNKTGTTSLKKAFEDFGYVIGEQTVAERLFDKYFFDNKFKKIIKYCETADVFQDVPFSYFKTIPHIDKAFPGSKFILSVRNSSDEWYNSITMFHAKLFGKNGRVPTYEDLSLADYGRKGMMTRVVDSHGTTKDNPYDKEVMIKHYEKHNADVIEYFKDRPNDLLIINLSKKDDYKRFCEFIGKEHNNGNFPWENKTNN